MVCESCGATYDDDLKTCPVCGVSAGVSYAKPNPGSTVQTVPPFVRKPEDGPASQLATQQPMDSSGSETSAASNINPQPIVLTSANKTNKFAYISLFLGIAIILLSIIIAVNSNKLYELYILQFIPIIVNIVFAFIGLADSKKIVKSKSLARVSLILSFVCIIVFLLGMYFYVLPQLTYFSHHFLSRLGDNNGGLDIPYF